MLKSIVDNLPQLIVLGLECYATFSGCLVWCLDFGVLASSWCCDHHTLFYVFIRHGNEEQFAGGFRHIATTAPQRYGSPNVPYCDPAKCDHVNSLYKAVAVEWIASILRDALILAPPNLPAIPERPADVRNWLPWTI